MSSKLPNQIFIFTNLSFACELYLKIVLSLEGREPPEHHDLWRIFNIISEANRKEIESGFGARFGEAGQDDLRHALAVQLRVHGFDYPPDTGADDKLDSFERTSDLKRILKYTGSS